MVVMLLNETWCDGFGRCHAYVMLTYGSRRWCLTHTDAEDIRAEVRGGMHEIDSMKARVVGAEDAVRALAGELAGWRSTSDKRMATITAGVNLLNNKLHDYQTENARELANQRARIATLEQAKVDERA